ncbi:MAG: polysaccharide biosynthesis protein PslG [Solirubrobacterales bacterium]|nr:polysaccharide biosynthesis protein PslG [Solirubrobacterales bacterium]
MRRARVTPIAITAVLALGVLWSAAPPHADAGARAAVGSALRQNLALRGMTSTKIACAPTAAKSARCRYTAKRNTPTGTVNKCKGKARLRSSRRGWKVRARDRCKIVRLGPPAALGFEEFGSDPKNVAISAAAGATTDRLLVNWSEIEAVPGVYDWSKYDQLYNRFTAAGIHPVLVAEGAPRWAAVQGVACGLDVCATPPASAHDSQWGRFVAEIARRYPLAKGIEIWNEPNYNVFWSTGPDPARYADLLKTSYSAIKNVNPGMPVILGGLYPYPVPGVAFSDPAEFLAGVYRHGAGSSFDAVGAHPYPSGPPWVQSIMDLLRPLRQVMAVNGDAMKPFWLTEVGVSTLGRASEAEQAAALTGLLDTAQTSGEIAVVLIHELKDQQGPWPEWTWGLGVLHADGTPKASFCALAARVGHSCAVPG